MDESSSFEGLNINKTKFVKLAVIDDSISNYPTEIFVGKKWAEQNAPEVKTFYLSNLHIIMVTKLSSFLLLVTRGPLRQKLTHKQPYFFFFKIDLFNNDFFYS